MSLPRLFAVLPLVLALLTGCTSSPPPGASATGAMRLAVHLPEAVPADVSRVTVTVSGSDIASRSADLSLSDGAWGGVLSELPAGAHRTFLAQAYTSSNTLRYKAQADDVTVTAGTTGLLTLTLQDVSAPPPLSNEAPIIDSLVASTTTVAPGGSISLAASAHDPNAGDSLTYAWSAPSGGFSTPTQASTSWTAPGVPGVVTLSLQVTDSRGASLSARIPVTVSGQSGGAEVKVGFNTTPTVEALTSSQSLLDVDQQTALSVSASDVDGDSLSYQWSATCAGGFTSTTSASTVFTPSARPGGTCDNCQVLVVVTDGRGGQTQGSLELCVAPPVLNSTGWSTTGAMVFSRGQHQLLTLSNGKVLAVRGGPTQTEVYAPATGTWSLSGVMSESHDSGQALLLADGRVLATGGYSAATAEVYDASTGTWSPTGSMSTPRDQHTATLLPDGKVLVAGGQNNGASLATAELYDPSTGTWSPTGSLAINRHSHSAVPLAGGKVLVTSGFGDGYATAEVYNPSTGTWSLTGNMTDYRIWHAAVVLPSGRVLISGGYGASGYLATAEVYDPATNTWSPAPSMFHSRLAHAATLLANGQVLVSGGYSDSSSPDLAELYTP